jgi:hypothetical protein
MEKLMEGELQARREKMAAVGSEDDTDIEQPAPKRLKLESVESEVVAPPSDYTYEESAVRFKDPFRKRTTSPAVDSVQQHSFDSPEVSPKYDLRIQHLHNKTTVIIGAGVVGLAIARELAAATKSTHTKHEIIVVEKRESYAEETSQHCFGIIAEHGVPEGYEDLLALSLQSWNVLLDAADNKYRAQLRHQADGVIHVERLTRDEENAAVARAPGWYEPRSQEVLNTYHSDIGKMWVSIVFRKARTVRNQFLSVARSDQMYMRPA